MEAEGEGGPLSGELTQAPAPDGPAASRVSELDQAANTALPRDDGDDEEATQISQQPLKAITASYPPDIPLLRPKKWEETIAKKLEERARWTEDMLGAIIHSYQPQMCT